MRADGAGHDDDVPGTRKRGGDVRAGQAAADPGRGNEDPVRGATTDDLGVSGDDGYAHGGRGRADGRGHPPQIRQLETLLDDIRDRQRQRGRAHHRQIVHSAVYGE